MNCKQASELLPEAAIGGALTGELETHLQDCADCQRAYDELRATFTLLDEWETPEPSPFFDVRLKARLREERLKQSWGAWHWLRRPALGYAAAAALFVGGGAYSLQTWRTGQQQPSPQAVVERGTAVGDLQQLDQAADLLANCDDMSVDDNTSEN